VVRPCEHGEEKKMRFGVCMCTVGIKRAQVPLTASTVASPPPFAPTSTHLNGPHAERVRVGVDAAVVAHHHVAPQVGALDCGLEAAEQRQ
jgi:hypothetical protein